MVQSSSKHSKLEYCLIIFFRFRSLIAEFRPQCFSCYHLKGVENLKKAASEVALDKPQLRRGQLIFGTVSVAHAADIDETSMGTIANWLAPALTKAYTNQTRWYAYLHVAVYAGQFRGTHYIIENGGTSRGKIGYVPYYGYEIVLNILKTS